MKIATTTQITAIKSEANVIHRLQNTKNFLAQKVEEIELSKKRKINRVKIDSKKIDGTTVFLYKGKIVAELVSENMLSIHVGKQVQVGDVSISTESEAINIDQIKVQQAMFCYRCKHWMEIYQNVKNCTCKSAFVPRKKFYVEDAGLSKLSDEQAEIIMAEMDRDTLATMSTKRPSENRSPKSPNWKKSGTNRHIKWSEPKSYEGQHDVPTEFVKPTSSPPDISIPKRVYRVSGETVLVKYVEGEVLETVSFAQKCTLIYNGKQIPEENKIPLIMGIPIQVLTQ